MMKRKREEVHLKILIDYVSKKKQIKEVFIKIQIVNVTLNWHFLSNMGLYLSIKHFFVLR